MPQLIHTQPNPNLTRWMAYRGSVVRALAVLVVIAALVVLILRTVNTL